MKVVSHRTAWKICTWMLIFLLSACSSDQFLPLDQIPESTRPEAIITPSPRDTALARTATPTLIQTPIQSPTIANPTPKPGATIGDDCRGATFVSDVTIPDGTIQQRDEVFMKIWRLKNTGECTWPGKLILELAGGEPFGGVRMIPFKAYPAGVPLIDSMGERNWADLLLSEVQPDEVVDLAVMFQAPNVEGDYFSLWSLRSPDLDETLLQIYVQIKVEGEETPEPTIWSGAWVQQNLHIGGPQSVLNLEQSEYQVRGFFYAPNGELYLVEGGLFDEGLRIEGTFGPPYIDGYPFTWRLTEDGQSFQGRYRDQLVSAGAWCGARSETDLPVPCGLEP